MTNLSLCSGYGGLDLAVEQITGNKTLVYAEHDKYASQVMAARFPWAVNLGDIKCTDWAALARDHTFTTITAGFPCQDISSAGRRKGITGARSGIWKNVAQAVGVIRPRYVFLENVAAIKTRGLDVVVADLAQIGYDARWTCLRAGDPAVGNPTPRDRWLCIAYPSTQDPDSAAWREWWAAAPGQAESGGTRADAGGRSGVPASDANGTAGRLNIAGCGPGSVQGAEVAERQAQQPGRLRGSSGGEVALAWGAFEPAIRRWEAILGRPAPAPTEPGTRGNRRLTPLFVEWLMGCDEGWVTDLDLPRNKQLKILGNGVVTRQAVEGYRRLLCADLEAMAA